jgi:peptide/nickel transport system permease protein
MWKYVARRALASIPVLLLASVLIFLLVREFGADPARQRCQASRDPQCIVRVRAQLELDRPVPVQYLDEMKSFVTGDWGNSLRSDRSVSELIRDAMAETVPLAFWAVVVSLVLAVLVGVTSARHPGSVRDHSFTVLAFAGIAMPTFWLGLLVIQAFTYELQKRLGLSEPIFYSIPNPVSSGMVDSFRELALPVFVLSVQLVAGWSRYQRAALADELHGDHIRTARAKGLSERRVVWKHGMRSSSTSLVTVVAIDAGALIGGVVVTERVFSRPGMGTLLLAALRDGDTAVLIPWMLVAGVAVILANLFADVLYAVLDPRVRLVSGSPS